MTTRREQAQAGEAATSVLPRDVALVDLYIGLRRIGYTHLGAVRGLRAVGVSLAEALEAADTAGAVGLGIKVEVTRARATDEHFTGGCPTCGQDCHCASCDEVTR